MEVRLIARPLKTSTTSPQLEAVRYARENGFELRREPFGRRGSLIEIYRNGEDLGYRKSYGAALNLMRKHAAAHAPSMDTTMDTSAQHAAVEQIRTHMATLGATGRRDFAAGLDIAAQLADQQAAACADRPAAFAQALEISAELHAKARAAAVIARRTLPRADRIRRLINRLDDRLADLRFAENLGYATAYAATQTSDGATTARAHHLAVRALRSANTLQRRAVRLAGAEIAALAGGARA